MIRLLNGYGGVGIYDKILYLKMTPKELLY